MHRHPLFRPYFKRGLDGTILDPYKTLDIVEEFIVASEGEAEEVVTEGTAAMKAYFEIMHGKGRNSPAKRIELTELLLQYCKLDTLAMVIIYYHWENLTQVH